MAKLTTLDLTNLSNESSFINTLNNNFFLVETALENTLSRDGTTPNQLEAVVDMNSFRVINLGEPLADSDAARKIDITAITSLILHTVSTTSVAIVQGSITFEVENGKSFYPNMYVNIVSDALSSNYMTGVVTSYSGTTLVVDVQTTNGSGTFDDWTIDIAGKVGPQGAGGGGIWGAITGTLTDQTDLVTALGLKADQTSVDSDLALKANIAGDVFTGNVGIGVSPDSTLHVHKASAGTATGTLPLVVENDSTSGVQILAPDDESSSIYFGAPSDVDAGRIIYGNSTVSSNSSKDAMRIYTNGVEAIRISSAGFLGITTTSPRQALDIGGAMAFKNSAAARKAVTYPTMFATNGAGVSYPFSEAGNLVIEPRTSGATRDFVIVGTGGANRFVVEGGGNVGVGVDFPTAKFAVDGPIRPKSYTVATTPSASSNGEGSLIFVSDETGGSITAFSDGSNWRRVSDRAIVS